MLPDLSKLCLHSGPCGDPVAAIDYNDRGVVEGEENTCSICGEPLLGPAQGTPGLPTDLERVRSSGSYYHRWCLAAWVVDNDTDPITRKRILPSEIDGMLAFRPPEPRAPEDPSDSITTDEAVTGVQELLSHYASGSYPSGVYKLGGRALAHIYNSFDRGYELKDRQLWYMCSNLLGAFNALNIARPNNPRRRRLLTEWHAYALDAIVYARALNPRVKEIMNHSENEERKDVFTLTAKPAGRTEAEEAVVDLLAENERSFALNDRFFLTYKQMDFLKAFLDSNPMTVSEMQEAMSASDPVDVQFQANLEPSERALVSKTTELVLAELAQRA